MAADSLACVLRRLRLLTEAPAAGDLSDGELLRRFCECREEAAFALLVQRHGPMVLGVCRRLLGDAHDSEDAFQATFLVLLRRASSIRKHASVGSWLYGVAYRVAGKARARAARRRGRERQGVDMPRTEPASDLSLRELRAVLDEELARLPEKYRAVVVLCHLESKTQEQAARELGCPKSSLGSRLKRARELLRERLAARGVELTAGLLGVLAGEQAAAVPARLVLATVRLAALVAAGKVATAETAIALADGVARAMGVAKLCVNGGVLVLVGLATAAAVWGHQALSGKPEVFQSRKGPPPPAQADAGLQAPRADRYGDPLPAGAVARLGTTRWRHGGTIGQIAFAPGRQTLAAAGNDDAVSLWDVPAGRLLRRMEGATAGINPGVVFSPDGKLMATGQYDRIRRWDAATGGELPSFPIRSFRAGKLTFSPDGQVLASLGSVPSGEQNVLVFVDAATGRELHRFAGLKMVIPPAFAFSPDSKTWAYTDHIERAIRLFDTQSGKELRRFEGHRGGAKAVAFSPDGRTVASTDHGDKLRFWDAASGRLLPHVREFRSAFGLTYSPDGKWLAGGSNFQGPVLFDVAAGQTLPALAGPRSSGEDVIVSPDGKLLAAANGQRVFIWDVAARKLVGAGAGHDQGLRAVAFAPDGRTVLSTAGEDGTVSRWDAVSGQELPPLGGFQDFAYALAYSPDRRTLAVGTGNHNGTVWLLDAASGRLLRSLKIPKGYVTSLAFSADGKTLASKSRGETHIWDVAAGKEVHVVRRGPGEPTAVALAPDGRTFAEGDMVSNTLHTVDVATGAEIRRFVGHRRGVHGVAYSPGGKRLASVGADGTVGLWDVATGIQRWQADMHGGSDYFIAFSPDGRSLATAGADGRVYLWEVETGHERCHFDGHRRSVPCGAFSADGNRLVTGSRDTTALVWDLLGAGSNPSSRTVLDLPMVWAELAGVNAARAYRALQRFASAPEQSVPWLRDHVRPARLDNPVHVAALLRDLNSDNFMVRQKAAQDLERLGDAAEPALDQVLRGKPSTEVRARIERLLAKLDWNASPERLRLLRAIEVLEHIGTPQAKAVLQSIADGAPQSRLTQEASTSLDRLAKRSVP